MGKIYTRKGDKGKTSLFDGKKVYKGNIKVETYASLDELNSVIGLASAFVKDKKIVKELEEIQNDLLEIGSSLAITKTKKVPQLTKRPDDFEKIIDNLTKKFPSLSNFILPGGSKGGALLHVSRTFTRRSERRVVALSKKEKIDPTILVYLNRLSDLLFVMARFANYMEKVKEKKWIKK